MSEIACIPIKVFYGPAVSQWQDYIGKILAIGLRRPIESTEYDEAEVLVEELGDQMRYIYTKEWRYSFLFSTEPFHHEQKPYTALFCGNNEINAEARAKCVLFPFYWFETKLNKELEALKPWSIDIPQKFACCFISNPLNEFRNKVVSCLVQLGYLDSYGLIGNNTGGRYEGNPIEKMREYRFCICFENAAHEAYVSEKLPNVLKAGIVPVYWGCPNIGKYFNKERFICVEGTNDDAVCLMITEMINLYANAAKWLEKVSKPIFPEGGSSLSLESMGVDLAAIIDRHDGRSTSAR